MHSKLFLFVALLCSTFSFGQISNELTSKIDSLIQLKNPRIFNGVILITQKGNPVYTKTHGFADFEKKIALKLSDQFKIMSNSKLFTSVLVMLQVEKGKIDLHAPIGNYLPQLSQSWKDSITVHQLLNHTHGIDEVNKPLLFKPGTDFKYGNVSNVLLGEILEKVTGKSFEELADNLFKKLKLRNTFCYAFENENQLVSGYNLRNNKPEIVTNAKHVLSIPAAGIISNAHDLAL
ncbi:serine hydrolase domain-containing protein [Moheibacter sediminis]|uniref:Beta-lactamase n=1 Tax=Moheibacter sediminis TaxID=1434700 RepID=A0A1W2BVM3_9FLAO|nr:serine hydrolase domain-containing protein [Moheibacter sediminis]SMC76652.1 Beta-lactamase [Moheibacter sediminis]